MKLKIIGFLIIVFLAVVFFNKVSADNSKPDEVKIVIEQFISALENEDIDLIKDLCDQKVLMKVQEFCSKYTIEIRSLKFESYKVLENENVFKYFFSTITVKKKKSNQQGKIYEKYSGTIYFTLRRINEQYYIVKTDIMNLKKLKLFYVILIIGFPSGIYHYWKSTKKKS